MNQKPKLLFVYDHPNPNMWMDGLSAALDVLEEDFEIEKLNYNSDDQNGYALSFLRGGYDFVLGWGAFNSRPDQFVQRFPSIKKGLCIAGNATPPEGANNYDILFYETDWIKNNYLPKHPKLVRAFGVNTDLYSPATIPTPIVWDHIGVGALANWKRWERMIDKLGKKLVIGEYQNGNETESLNIARELIRGGVMVSNQVSPFDLVNYYHWSRTLYMPSDIYGGGERAVLEALACGLNVEIEGDNPKLQELLDSKVPTHHDYAKALKGGILSVL